MQRKLTLALTGVFTFLLFSALTIAQDEAPKDQLYLLHQDVIKVDMVDQYEATVAKEVELWKKHKLDLEIRWASQTDDNEYYYVTPIDNMGDIDKMDAVWAKFTEAAGDAYAKVNEGYEGTYVYHRNMVWRWSAELSYIPENRRVAPKDITFIHWDNYFIKEGKFDEAKEVMLKYKDLIASNNVADPYGVWICELGGDIGWIVVTRNAESSVGFYTQATQRREEMGEEFNKLWAEFSPLLKKFEHRNGMPRPEFTYRPGE